MILFQINQLLATHNFSPLLRRLVALFYAVQFVAYGDVFFDLDVDAVGESEFDIAHFKFLMRFRNQKFIQMFFIRNFFKQMIHPTLFFTHNRS